MNHLNRSTMRPSLLERAAARWDLAPHPVVPGHNEPTVPDVAPLPVEAERVPPKPAERSTQRDNVRKRHTVDRALLAEAGMLAPGGPVTPLAEEFRLVKRQVIATAKRIERTDPDAARMILVCSGQPGDGKTFCAINLALSLAAERDVEVLLVDADFPKPDILPRLGLSAGPGLLDALADPAVMVEDCVLRTDVPQLSVLPAGPRGHDDTELLSSDRARAVLEQLLAADPSRIIVFDSPPALAASPAPVLSSLVGQVVLIVRADRSSESDLREAVALLDGCEEIQLLLNAVTYRPDGQRFGTYYGEEQ